MTHLRDDETRCVGVMENLGKRHATRVTCVRRFDCARYCQINRDRMGPGTALFPSTSYACLPGSDQFISERFGRDAA